jgi:hypothetical protein
MRAACLAISSSLSWRRVQVSKLLVMQFSPTWPLLLEMTSRLGDLY